MDKLEAIRTSAALSVAIVCGMVASSASASLQDQVDQMFDSMSNVTNPAAVMGQRRGLLAGGRYSMRSQVMDVELLSVLPPSLASGCNGIDLFGGSFSFVSADQFIQLLRTIAANASGYAFKMALQAMCPSCDAVMSNLQGLIQKLNRLSVSSCQAAKTLVATAAAATPQVLQTAVAGAVNPIAERTGAATDTISAMFPSVGDGGTSLGAVAATSSGRGLLEDKQILGNVVWSALKESGAANWWDGGDANLMEAVMSVTGSVIVRPPTDENAPPAITPLPPILAIKDFMTGMSSGGSGVSVYECVSYACYNPADAGGPVTDPATHTVSIESFGEKVEQMVASLVSKFSTNTSLTADEEAFMASAPAAIGGIIRNLSRMTPGMAVLYANQAAPAIAQIMAADLVLNMVKTARLAMATSTSPAAVQMRQQLADVSEAVRAQAANIQGELATLTGLIGAYDDLMAAAHKRRLGIDELVTDAGLMVR